MNELRIGVVGLGWITETYVLPVYRALDGVRVSAVCDVARERADAVAAACGSGTAAYTDYRAMLAAGGLDGVVVAVAPHVTAEISAAFLGAGVHTYVEKPPGITVAETEGLQAAARQGGARAMVAFNRRYMPSVDRIRALVAEMGPVRQASFEFFKASDTDPSASVTTHDPLTGTGIHGVDLLRYLLGDAHDVAARCRRVGSPVPNSFAAVMGMGNDDTSVSLNVYWNAGLRRERYSLHGDAYSLILEKPDELYLYEHGEAVRQDRAGGADDMESLPGFASGFPQELSAFIGLIRNGGVTRSPLDDAVKTMALIDKIIKINKK